MLRGVDRLIFRVPAVAAAATFWSEAFGLIVVRQDDRVAVLRFADRSAEIVLHADEDLPAEAAYIRVDDLRALYEQRAALRLQFSAPPARVARGYTATVRDPFGVMLHLIDRAAEAGEHAEDVRPAEGTLFAGVSGRSTPQADALIALYQRAGRTADDLPYTPDFEAIYGQYIAGFPVPQPDREEVWRHLLTLRKSGRLPRLGDARSRPPEIEPDQRQRLRDLLGDDIGRRDRLPYSPRFERVVEQFNEGRQRPMSPHLVWRLVATLAK